MNKKYIAILIVFVLLSGTIFYIKRSGDLNEKVIAGSDSVSVSTQGDWDLGSKSNILTNESGQFLINDKNATDQKIDLTNKTITTTQNDGTKTNAFDGDLSTHWDALANPANEPPDVAHFTIDLGVETELHSLKIKHDGQSGISGDIGWFYFTGTNDPDNWPPDFYAEVGISGSGLVTHTFSPTVSFRYIRLVGGYSGIPGDTCTVRLYELELYEAGATATHTTGATQIDGGENFWSWDSNTIAQTVPENTTATYQYRTSANGTDWTSWVGAIGSVTNRAGDDSNNPTRYRYLQIKATLSNTDGTSTPTIDSYSIDYHTEIKPSQPTGQTAVIR